MLLLQEEPELPPEHREEFLSLALWKVKNVTITVLFADLPLDAGWG
jgi:hypothetical protein